MIEIIVTLTVLFVMFWIGYHVTGALLSTAIWLFVKLPFAIIIACLGLMCCVTILLIPLGGKCFKVAGSILF